jgi:hypothetical protein
MYAVVLLVSFIWELDVVYTMSCYFGDALTPIWNVEFGDDDHKILCNAM